MSRVVQAQRTLSFPNSEATVSLRVDDRILVEVLDEVMLLQIGRRQPRPLDYAVLRRLDRVAGNITQPTLIEFLLPGVDRHGYLSNEGMGALSLYQ